MAILIDNTGGLRWDIDRAFANQGWPPPFPRGISLGDIDRLDVQCTKCGAVATTPPDNALYITEMDKQFLYSEFKRNGHRLSNGQRYTAQALTQIGAKYLIIHGEPPFSVNQITDYATGEVIGHNLSDLHAIYADWARGK